MIAVDKEAYLVDLSMKVDALAVAVRARTAKYEIMRAALERIERTTGSTGGYKALCEDNRTTARIALAATGAV